MVAEALAAVGLALNDEFISGGDETVNKISRIETGNSGLQIEDVATLLDLYQVPSTTRDDLLDLARRTEERGW